MFTLCRTCVESQNSLPCTHTDDERCLSGSWVSFELQAALDRGYKLISIDEIWHFEEKTRDLFKSYVQDFLKSKQQASGYPAHILTDKQKDEYIADFQRVEGIILDKEKIIPNKALRSCNKLLLNSLWGRFSMRCDLPTCEIITDPDKFTQLMFSDHFNVSQFNFLTDDAAIVQWRHVDSKESHANDVNVILGAITTAHARLELYALLEKLGKRVLYCDTDSVIFTEKPGEWLPPLGDYLGDLTSELADGDHITDFAACGPKCYAYVTCRGHRVVKCKGITLRGVNEQLVTYDSLLGLVRGFVAGEESKHILTTTDRIKKHKMSLQLSNETLVKRLQVVYDKRRLLNDFSSRPYGY